MIGRRLRSERGMVMPIACSMLLAVVALTGVGAKAAISAASQSTRDRGVKRAVAAADQATSVALYRLNQLQPKPTECVRPDVNGILSVESATLSADDGDPGTVDTNNWCAKVNSATSGETSPDDDERYSYFVSTARPGPTNSNTELRTVVATGLSGKVKRRTMTVIARHNSTWGPFAADVAKNLFISGSGRIDQIANNGVGGSSCKWCPLLNSDNTPGSVRALTGRIQMNAQSAICGKLVFGATGGDTLAFPVLPDPVVGPGHGAQNDGKHDHPYYPGLPPHAQDTALGKFDWSSSNQDCWTDATQTTKHPRGPLGLERWEPAALACSPGTDEDCGLADARSIPAVNDNQRLTDAFCQAIDPACPTTSTDSVTNVGLNAAQWNPSTQKLVVKSSSLVVRGGTYVLCYLEVGPGGTISVQSTGPGGTHFYLKDPKDCPNNPGAGGAQYSNVQGLDDDEIEDSVVMNGGGKMINARLDSPSPDPSKVSLEVQGNSLAANEFEDTVWLDNNFSQTNKFQAISINAPRSLVGLHGTSAVNGVRAEYLDIDGNSAISWDPRIQASKLGISTFGRQQWFECTTTQPTISPISGCEGPSQ